MIIQGEKVKIGLVALKAFLSTLVYLMLSVSAFGVTADPVPVISRTDPEVLLKEATAELLKISKAARGYASDDRERYYEEVSAVLDQVMDIQYFARGVMATYASARAYTALQTDAERAAFRDRVARFVIGLKRVWMVKYAEALLVADGESVDIVRINTGDNSDERASLQQTIRDSKNQTYLLQYSLHKAKDGGWLISNVIVEGINLGETYRSQFSEAVENHKGDVDYVVDNWVELMIHEASSASDSTAGTEK
jgi:phospholipid transport system substrate-binding protein